MPTNTPIAQVTELTTDAQRAHLKEVHEHLRHASTTDRPDEIRERMRMIELALQRHEQQQAK